MELFGYENYLKYKRKMNIKEILELVNKIIDLEKQIETKVKSIKDVKKREKIQKAFEDRDYNTLRNLMFDN